MKKLLANLLTLTVAAASLPAVGAEAADSLSAEKTAWIVGTSGTITGEGLTSSAPEIVTVNADGSFEAKAAGNAVITDANGESLTLHVYEKAPEDVVQSVYEDAASGKLDYDYSNRYKKMSELRKGTKLWSYMADGGIYQDERTGTVYTSGIASEDPEKNGKSDTASLGFVYKLDGVLDSVTLNTFGYDETAVAAARTELGYVTTGDTEFETPADGKHSLGGEKLTQYATEFALLGSWTAPIGLSNMWTPVELPAEDWSSAGADGLDKLVTTDKIPPDAEYIGILLNMGILKDGTAPIVAARYRYKGITLHYRKNLMAGEVTKDQQIALTFNGDVSDETMIVRKNGQIIEPNVRYDESTYTKYIENTFAAGDYVEVTTKHDQYTVMIPGYLAAADYDRIYFAPEKHTFLENTSGKIDLITEKDGEKRRDLLPTAYTSSAPEIAEVDQKGHITAKKAGTAEITPSVPSLDQTFAPITIQVYAPAEAVNSDVAADAASGKLTLDYERGVNMSEKRHGTDVWAYASDSPMYYSTDGSGVMTNTHYSTEYMAFVYRLNGPVKHVKVNTFGYGGYDTYAPERTDIAYLTDDAVTFGDKTGSGSYTWDHEALNAFGAEGGIVGDAKEPIKLNEKVWTKIPADQLSFSYTDNRDIYFETSEIPAEAKYLVVLLKLGTLEDGTNPLSAQFYRFKGVSIDYETTLLDAELNLNQQAVLTLSKQDSNVIWTVKKNGAVLKDAKIRYDEKSGSYYVDGAFTAGDRIEITSQCGSYTQTIEDNREQLAGIVLKNEDGEVTEELSVGATKYTVAVNFRNASTGNVYAALYGEDGRLKQCVTKPVGETVELTLESAGIEGGDTLRVFGWHSEMMPYPIYNEEIVSSFVTGDF